MDSARRCFSVSVPEDDFDDEDILSDSDSLVETEMPLPSPHKPVSQLPPTRAAGQGPTIDLTHDIATGVYHQSSATLPNFVGSDIIDLTSEPEQASELEQPSGLEQTSESERDDEPRRIRRQSTPFPPVSQLSINVDSPVSSPNVAWQTAREVFFSKARDAFTSAPSTSNITDENREPEVSKRDTQMAKLDEYYGTEIIRRSASQMADLIDFDIPRYNDGDNSSTSGSESAIHSSDEIDSNLTDSEEHSVLSDESTSDLVSQDSDNEDHNSMSSELGEEYGATDFEDEDEGMWISNFVFFTSQKSSTRSNYSALDLHYTDGSPSSLSSDDEPLDDSMFPDDQSRSESIPSSPVEPEAKTLPSKLPDGDTTEVGQSSEDPVSHRLASTAPFTSFVNRHRLPSPSDAAMVKTLPFGGWCATTSTAQALGEMTGKYEYFTAREDNRATFMNMDRPRSPPIPISAIRETLGASELARDAAGPCNSPVHTIFLAPKPAMSNKLGVTKSSDASPLVDSPKPVESSSSGRTAEGPKPAPTGINQDSVWSTSGDKFINSPASAEPSSSRTRLQSPDFDMTSAFTFQQSKLAKENKTEHTVKPVRIQDLLAQEPNSMEPLEKTIKPVVTIREYTDNTPRAQTGSKRTFDDAFDDLDLMESDDDIADVISNSSDAIALRDLELPAGSSQPKQDSITGAVSESLAASPRQIAARPAKRRRFAEVAACVAIGGASVLSALIMSAPTFT